MTWVCGLLASVHWWCDPGMSCPAPSPIYTLRGAGGPLNTLHFRCHGGDTPLLFSGLVICLSIHNFDFSFSLNGEEYFYLFLFLNIFKELTKLVLNFVSQRRNSDLNILMHVICTIQASQSWCTSVHKTYTESKSARLSFKAPHHTSNASVSSIFFYIEQQQIFWE